MTDRHVPSNQYATLAKQYIVDDGRITSVNGQVAIRLFAAWLDERRAPETSGVSVGGEYLPITLAQFTLRASVLLGEEQRRPNPNNALIGFISDALRLARENERMATSPVKTSGESSGRIEKQEPLT